MILLASNTVGMGVFTIRVGGRFASISGLLVNPHTLKIAAFWVDDGHSKQHKLLLVQDIREITPKAVIIDDHGSLVEPGDLPRLEEILAIDYQLPGKKVRSGSKTHGKVSDFGFRTHTFEIANVSGKPSISRLISNTRFSFARKQITAVNDKAIEVDDSPLGSHNLKRQTNKSHLGETSAYS